MAMATVAEIFIAKLEEQPLMNTTRIGAYGNWFRLNVDRVCLGFRPSLRWAQAGS